MMKKYVTMKNYFLFLCYNQTFSATHNKKVVQTFINFVTLKKFFMKTAGLVKMKI